MKLTVVMQGPVTQWTPQFIQKYKQIKSVKEVILSTWLGEDTSKCQDANIIVESKQPTNPGKGNRNLQIVSSLNGVREANTRYVLKVRSDMFLPQLEKMLECYVDTANDSIKVLSIYPRFVFHPRDHVFLGTKDELTDLFNIPLDDTSGVYNETIDVRTETYIGMYYYSLFNSKIKTFIDNPLEYLTDISPSKNEAKRVYDKLIEGECGFTPFPEFEVEWPKHYPNGYPFQHLKNFYGETFG